MKTSRKTRNKFPTGPVFVAGVWWNGYLNPTSTSPSTAVNEKSGIHYFNLDGAKKCVTEQGLKIPTSEDFQHLLNKTSQLNATHNK